MNNQMIYAISKEIKQQQQIFTKIIEKITQIK